MKNYPGGIRHDYTDAPNPALAAYWRHWMLFAIGVAVPLISVYLLLLDGQTPPEMAASIPSVAPPLTDRDGGIDAVPNTVLAQHPMQQPIRPPAPNQTAENLDLEVRRGDTLETLFRRNDINLADLAAMASLPDASDHLRLLRPGDRIQVVHDGGRVLSLTRELDEIDLLSIERDGAGFRSRRVTRAVEYRTVGGQGAIRSSLFAAAARAGLSDATIIELAEIFQWDIDFLLDVRVGDQFAILYQELWREGVKVGDGRILAAEFVNQGKSFRAARYTDGDGRTDYFTPEGRSVRKAFVRAPVNFTRISGNFNPTRKHPILNTIRAHRGVDYAAPTGTPVRAAGDGKIIQRGRNGGFGNSVTLQHGGSITTLYAHLSRFAKHKVGNRIKQNDIIGYVGQSGLATGPHLHYEYRINGTHRNPRTVTLPPADPVPPKYREDFQTVSASLWSQLDLYKRAWVAENVD